MLNKKLVEVEFITHGSHADFGKIWPGRRKMLTPAQAQKVVEVNKFAKFVDEKADKKADAEAKAKADAEAKAKADAEAKAKADAEAKAAKKAAKNK